MDLLDIVQRQINALPDGDHVAGLGSVLIHINSADRHLTRAQLEQDETLYTDAIYRSNQAFEGGVKEAYRVLAGKDPAKKSVFEIEEYLQKNNVFKDRILAQFTNYRQEWRNPSTHDYNLKFDDAEAFLAIVSVAAFAKLLVDKVAAKLAFQQVASSLAMQDVEAVPVVGPDMTSLVDRVEEVILEFAGKYLRELSGMLEIGSERQLLSALAAWMTQVLPDANLSIEESLAADRRYRPDFVVRLGNSEILVEVKNRVGTATLDDGVQQLLAYMHISGIQEGVLFLFDKNSKEYQLERHLIRSNRITVILPNK